MQKEPIHLKPGVGQPYEHCYDAMNAFLDGNWFEIASGDAEGSFTLIDRYPAGTEFVIHYLSIMSDYTFDKHYPLADRHFTIRFRKPATLTIH